MVKGALKTVSFYQSKESSMKAKEARHNTSPARPPLSAFSASARNKLGAVNISPIHSTSNTQAEFDRGSSKVKIMEGLSGQVSFSHTENVDSSIGSSSSNCSSPERFSSPFSTPSKRKSKRSGIRKLSLGSADLENVHGQNSTDGDYKEHIFRTSSNTRSDAEATTTDDSDPSSMSESEPENVCLSRRVSARRQEGLRRISLGPKIEASVTKFNTPCKPLISLAGRIRTPCASPGSLRAGVQRSLVLQQPDLKDHNQAHSHFDLEENLSFWDDHSVQVVIRARPLSTKESSKQDISRCLRQDGPRAITWLGQSETRFTFDHVADESISQEKLFKVVGLPIVENCLAGYNSCMFAYGQTGSGKTHTMLGGITGLGDGPSDDRGMIPRIFEYLFSKIQQEEQDRKLDQLRYVCKCSFLEIYNEQITDLLEPSSSNLQMREDSKKGVYVENLTEIVVSSLQDVVLLLLKGAASRKVASTKMNRESSRSHCVFTCSIESKWETNSLCNVRFRRLNLVDLAGSERQKSSKAEGDLLKEAASINKSLSTLGLVIMALVDIANGKPRHVPYRDSKLTFLLQDSLGGNSKTAIIATVSPSSCCAMETLSTLKFAQRAKFIQNNAVVNEDASGDVLALQREIQQLKEEFSRLRCQTISSIRRECRRNSNEFFRLSMTRKDLIDAAEKECTNEVAELNSDELLEKIKALELVLAGALRREQEVQNATKQLSVEFEKANRLIEEREIEVRNCKNLLRFHADESLRLQSSEDIAPFSDSEKHVILDGSLECKSRITKLEMENLRLTDQLRSYQNFIDAGEKEIMAAEIQGLRDQVLELLDEKIAVERGSLSTTIAQDDSYRKELETCRNDLTKCLEASSKLQRQAVELNSQVNLLTAQCAEKEKELDLIKESKMKYANMTKLKEVEINTLQSKWETATAKLFCNLLEGERALIEVGQEMDQILGEDWLLRNVKDNTVRWSIESVKSLKEVDVEHDYFEGRDACDTEDIFGERRTAMRKRSSGISPRCSVMSEEKLELEASVARLEQELEQQRQRARKEDQFQEELDIVQREKCAMEVMEALVKNSLNIPEIHKDNADLKVELQQLRVQLHEWNDTIDNSRSQISALDRKPADLEEVNSDKAEVLAMRAQEASVLREENLKLLHETAVPSQELTDVRVNSEDTHSGLVDKVRVNDKLTEGNALLKLQAEKDAVHQTCLNSKISYFEVVLKTQQEMSELESEIKRFSLSECSHQELETTMKSDNESIVVLEEANGKLDSAVKMTSQKLALTERVQEELRATVSSLHVELQKKIRKIEVLDLQAMSNVDVYVEELNLRAADLKSCQVRIAQLQASIADNNETLRKLEEALMVATATFETVKMESDEARAHADEAQARTSSNCTRTQELLEKLDLKSFELQSLSDLMHLIATEMNSHFEHFQSMSQSLSQEIKHEHAALGALLSQLLSLTSALEQNPAESKRTEDNLLTEILSLKEQLKCQCTMDVTSESETRLKGEVLALAEIVKSTELENDRLKEELAALQAVVLEHRNTIEVDQLTVEDLQTQLQRKEDVLHGLEFDLSLLQEHAAEDTDFKQELLKANARILELQEEVQTRFEEMKVLDPANIDMEERLARKVAAMTVVENPLLETETGVAFATTDCRKLNSRISRMQISLSLLEAELAEKHEVLSSQQKELIVARDTSTRMTIECSHKTEACLSLQGELLSLSAERDDLKSECTILVGKVDSLEECISQKVAEVEALHAELLVSKMTECFLQELKSDLESRTAYLEVLKAAHDAEHAHTNENMELIFKLLRTGVIVDHLKQDTFSLEAYNDELQVERVCLNPQLTQRSRAKTSLQGRISESTSQFLAEPDRMKSQIEGFQSLNLRFERDLALKIGAVISLEAEVMTAKTHTAESLEQNVELRARTGDESDELRALKDERDQALVEVQTLHAELRAAQALVASHKSSVLEAQKFAEVTNLLASGKEEARTLKASVSTLKNHNNELEKQLEATKQDAEKLRQSRDKFEIELQGMKNRMAVLQAVQSTGPRTFKGFQAAQTASLDLQKRLEDKETEVFHMHKRITVLHSQNEAQASLLEVMETELAYVHQELDELQAQCEEKDAQFTALRGQLKEAETLTQDVMRDLHNVKLDISNYASLVSQQQLDLIAERARHTDEAREKDEELSNLRTQLNQERQNWIVEMNHKQAEIVVARVLSEKMRLKNKSLAAEYKRLKADYGVKKKKLKFLEQQLTHMTTETRRFSIGTESEADFDEVQQFQTLLAQAKERETMNVKR